jgi:methionyl-tRNA formyltransferase
LRIVFLATAEFAVPSLRELVAAGYTVVAVVTAPDKPAGRGKQLGQSPVKTAALELGIPLLQPEKLKDPEFLAALGAYKPDLNVVVAFRMLPEVVWAMPPLGSVNLHGSLLPKYRGAAPIHWAIAGGETETGVTTFFLKHEIDTGDLILQRALPIGPNDTTGDIYPRLAALGAALIVETCSAIQAQNPPRTPQIAKGPMPHAPKLNPDNTAINWDLPANQVHNFIRGMSPSPCAHTRLEGIYTRIYRTAPATPPLPDFPSGALALGPAGELLAACATGWVEILELQLEGKKRVSARDYLNGNRGKLPLSIG